MKKYLKTAAVAVTMLGASAVAAPQALAADDTGDGPYANGNGSTQAYGNTRTGGYMSPNMALINGSFNKPCIALPQVAKNIGGTTAVSDILSQNQNQTCAENSSADQGDAPFSHLLDDFPILSGNGAGNNAG